MEEEELRKGGDKVINVSYMLCGVLEECFEEMDEIVERLEKRLDDEDRRLISCIGKEIKLVKWNIEWVRRDCLGKMDEESVEWFDDSSVRLYVMLMKLVEIGGIDYVCDLGLYWI